MESTSPDRFTIRVVAIGLLVSVLYLYGLAAVLLIRNVDATLFVAGGSAALGSLATLLATTRAQPAPPTPPAGLEPTEPAP